MNAVKPVTKTKAATETEADELSYADESHILTPLAADAAECPICAAKNYMPNAETIAVIEETRAMMRGDIPSTLRSFNSLEEMLEDLDRDEPDDDLENSDD